MKAKLKVYFLETRPQFLILSLVLVFLGTAMAWADGSFSWLTTVLAVIGLTCLHASVNILNDYFDFKSGIDLKVQRTPFSGGSGILPAGAMSPRAALVYGLVTFAIAVPIGVYFCITVGWQLLPLLVVGGLSVLIYTQYLTKMGHGVGEAAAGLGLGTLPVLGAYFVQAGHYSWPALIASIPSGILVCNLLFLNEFPDAEADVTANRRTLPITMGKRAASRLYVGLTITVYVWIVGGVIARLVGWPGLPAWTLLSLLTLPFALKAIKGAGAYDDRARLVPALGSNVMMILATQALMGVGYIGAHFI